MYMVDVETLVPQRPPFLFIDNIVDANEKEIIGEKTYGHLFPFAQNCPEHGKIVPGALLVESIVQCGGAGVTLMNLVKESLWGLASLEKVHFYGSVPLGSTVRMQVRNLKVTNRILRQTGTAFVDGERVLEATWLCLVLKAGGK